VAACVRAGRLCAHPQAAHPACRTWAGPRRRWRRTSSSAAAPTSRCVAVVVVVPVGLGCLATHQHVGVCHRAAQVRPHVCYIQDKDPSFYRQFKVIIGGLDNLAARRWGPGWWWWWWGWGFHMPATQGLRPAQAPAHGEHTSPPPPPAACQVDELAAVLLRGGGGGRDHRQPRGGEAAHERTRRWWKGGGGVHA
jgi:hypothetical protein